MTAKKAVASYSPEVRDRAVRLVLEGGGDHPTRWAAINSLVAKLGCTTETLRKWVRQAERDGGSAARADDGRVGTHQGLVAAPAPGCLLRQVVPAEPVEHGVDEGLFGGGLVGLRHRREPLPENVQGVGLLRHLGRRPGRRPGAGGQGHGASGMEEGSNADAACLRHRRDGPVPGQMAWLGRGARLRFIPTCAGNTRNTAQSRIASTVHPRMRGEHNRRNRRVPSARGSSPHARGTRADPDRLLARHRFIPACAGNTS